MPDRPHLRLEHNLTFEVKLLAIRHDLRPSTFEDSILHLTSETFTKTVITGKVWRHVFIQATQFHAYWLV